jgi:hypothetical protein
MQNSLGESATHTSSIALSILCRITDTATPPRNSLPQILYGLVFLRSGRPTVNQSRQFAAQPLNNLVDSAAAVIATPSFNISRQCRQFLQTEVEQDTLNRMGGLRHSLQFGCRPALFHPEKILLDCRHRRFKQKVCTPLRQAVMVEEMIDNLLSQVPTCSMDTFCISGARRPAASLPGVTIERPGKSRRNFLGHERFGQVIIHAGIEASFPVAAHRMGSQGNDRQM